MRCNAALWVRPDAARFLKPGTRVEDVFPALALKYAPNQPRVPAGSGRESGRWTDGSSSGRPRVIIDTTDLENAYELDEEGFGSAAGSRDSFDVAESNPGFDAPIAGDSDRRYPDRDEEAANDLQPGRPSGITDTRVISDADPEVVKPGEQYVANIRSLTDSSGRPYYAPGGHHEVPQAVFKKWNLPPETQRVFDLATTGTLSNSTVRTSPDGVPLGHTWDKAHREYNRAVYELGIDFMERNKIGSGRMTPAQAIELLAEVRQSGDLRIRDYNKAMRMLHRVFRFRSGRSE